VKLRIQEAESLRSSLEEKSKVRPNPGILDKDGKYYLVRLEMEIEKLKSRIDESQKDLLNEGLPEEAAGKIRNAVGKAQLLIKKKFPQFDELCKDNIEGPQENNPEKKETKASDLEGYWEMMNIQIEDVKGLFDEVDKIRLNDWKVLDVVDGPKTGKNGSPSTLTPKTKRKATSKSPKPSRKGANNNNINEEKVRKEARSRLAAARKLAKERQLEAEQARLQEQSNSSSSSLNDSLNSFEISSDTPSRSSCEISPEPADGTVVNTPDIVIDSQPDVVNGPDAVVNGKLDDVSTENEPDVIVRTNGSDADSIIKQPESLISSHQPTRTAQEAM